MKVAKITLFILALVVLIALFVAIPRIKQENLKRTIEAKSLQALTANHENFWIHVSKPSKDEGKAFQAGVAKIKGIKAKLRIREYDIGAVYYCYQTEFMEQSGILDIQTIRCTFEKGTLLGIYTAELEITRGGEKAVIPCLEGIEVK